MGQGFSSSDAELMRSCFSKRTKSCIHRGKHLGHLRLSEPAESDCEIGASATHKGDGVYYSPSPEYSPRLFASMQTRIRLLEKQLSTCEEDLRRAQNQIAIHRQQERNALSRSFNIVSPLRELKSSPPAAQQTRESYDREPLQRFIDQHTNNSPDKAEHCTDNSTEPAPRAIQDLLSEESVLDSHLLSGNMAVDEYVLVLSKLSEKSSHSYISENDITKTPEATGTPKKHWYGENEPMKQKPLDPNEFLSGSSESENDVSTIERKETEIDDSAAQVNSKGLRKRISSSAIA